MARKLEEGTKEEILAHHASVCDTYTNVINKQNEEINLLKNELTSLSKKYSDLEASKGVHIPDKIQYENARLKEKLNWLITDIKQFANGLENEA